MHKTKNTVLIIFAIVIVGCLVYAPGIQDLGLYRDDWNNYYTAVVRGPEMLKEHFAVDRPAMGALITVLYSLFKTNNTAYLIWNLCCRILGCVFLALTLLNVWPKTPKMAGLAGILAVIFPGFLQQIDGIDYTAHQTAMLCFMISLWLTSLACRPGEKSWNVLFTFLSLIFSLGNMMLMEYYVGMEIYRFAVIYLMNREQAENGKLKAFFKALLSYLPYLIPAAGFVYWRSFYFQAERTGANVINDVIRPIMENPRHELLDLGVRTVKSVWKLFAGVWTIPAYNLINGLSMKAFLTTLIPVLVIFAVSQLFLFLMHRKKTEDSVADANNESAQWLWCGLISGTISILPLILAGRDINFTSSLERFSWVGMIGTILFLVGLLGSMRDRTLRNILFMAAVLMAIFVQWQNKENYIDEWQMTKDYWQQLIWRAPGLKPGATIVTQGAFLAEEDYEIFEPAAMIYYPDESDWCPIGAEVMSTGTIRDIKLGKKTSREVRNVRVVKDYQALLAITKPYNNSCLRVIDGENPVYSPSDWTKIPEIGSYSKLNQILLYPDHEPEIPFFLGEEQEHGWCYYYEKMELALQMEDPESAAGLADEASDLNLKAGDKIELLPVIEAYVRTGRTDDALDIAESLHWDEFLGYTAANYFAAKADADLYSDVIRTLNGESEEPELSEETVPEETADPESAAENENAEEMNDGSESDSSVEKIDSETEFKNAVPGSDGSEVIFVVDPATLEPKIEETPEVITYVL